ncbi:MAG: glutamate synthase-related protein [Armatimonadota bacterium]|nr:glutamate synthase-related protein [Armatimonadota bacterium]
MKTLAGTRYHIETRAAPTPFAPPARFRLAEQDEYVKYGHAPFETGGTVDPYWTPEIITQTWYMAERGKIPISGAGYGGPFAGPGFDGLWLDMSEIVRPTRDGIHGREYISTSVDLGRPPEVVADQPSGPLGLLELPIPVIFNPYPLPSPNRNPVLAVAMAARDLGTLALVEPDQWQPDLDPHAKALALRIPVGRLEALRSLWMRVPYLELEGEESQAADGLLQAAARVAEERPSAVVGFHLPLGPQTPALAAHLVGRGAAVLHLYADEYGQTPAGFVADVLRAVHGRLVEDAIRDRVTLIVSGGIASAEHVPKAIACGADLVAVDFTLPVALGCALWADRSHCGAEAGEFDPAWGARRLVNLMAAWRDQLLECLGAMGMREVRRLRGEVGRVIFHAAEEAQFRALFPAVHPNGASDGPVVGEAPVLGDLRWTPEVLQATWTMAETGRPPAHGDYAIGRSGGGFDVLRFVFEVDPAWEPPERVGADQVDISLHLNRRGFGPEIAIPLPVYGGGMSFGSVSLQTMLARARAAAEIGTFTSTGEGGYPDELIPWADHIITQVATGLFGVREETIQRARFVEFKYAQGAKPGLGGHLLGGKVTEAVASMRESVAWISLYSPFPFHSVYSVEDHKKHVDWIRTVNPRALVSVKVSTPTDVDMVAVGIYHAGAHIVHLDGGYGGTGAAPEIAKKNIAMPIEYAIPKVHRFLVQEGIRDEIVLIASGGIRTPYDAAKAIALGADGVVVGMADLVALGCTRLADCEKGRGCPFGITTTDPDLSRLIDPDWGTRRIANLYRAWMVVLREITSRLGLRSIADLRGRTDLLRYVAGGGRALG